MMTVRPECILITGISGYIGRHFSQKLKEETDIQIHGFGRSNSRDIFVDEYFTGDIRNPEAVSQAMEGCDAVVHLACMPMGQSENNPQEGFAINAQGTVNVLEAARISGVKQVIYVSTGQVYGYVNQLPISEDVHPEPHSIYAASKLAGEQAALAYVKQFGMGVSVLRLFNVYGSAFGEIRPTVESVFLQRALRGETLEIKAPRGEGRDFIHILDVVRALHLAVSRIGSGEVINIGTGALTTLVTLAKLAVLCTGSRSKIVEADIAGVPLRFQAEIQKAEEVLEFRVAISLEAGLSGLSNQMLLE